MEIDCISDLHGHYPKLEGGDLLIVAGDLTATDTEYQHDDFFVWLNSQPYKKKIFIAGNHDNYLQKNNEKFIKTLQKSDLEYLYDSGTEFEGLKVWGSPWTNWFPQVNPKCTAFMLKTEEQLAEKWAMIPDDTDILITHSPPYGILDKNIDKYKCGSPSLREKMFQIKPRMHVFGHIHENGYKYIEIRFPPENPKIDLFQEDLFRVEIKGALITRCLNASHVNERYEPVNKPIRIVL